MDTNGLVDKFGPNFHLTPPAGSDPIFKDQSVVLTPATPVNFIYPNICQIKLKTKQAIVLQQYGLIGAQFVPSTEFVGMIYRDISPIGFSSRISWSVYTNRTNLINNKEFADDGVGRGGFGLLTVFRVGQGDPPLIIIGPNTVYIRVQVIGLGGETISPLGVRLYGVLHGYSLFF